MVVKRHVILYLAAISMLFAVGYWVTRAKPQQKVSKQPTKDFSIILNFDGKDTQNVDVSDQEVQDATKAIDSFEKYKYQKDSVSALSFIAVVSLPYDHSNRPSESQSRVHQVVMLEARLNLWRGLSISITDALFTPATKA
jgi:hypothetical protein